MLEGPLRINRIGRVNRLQKEVGSQFISILIKCMLCDISVICQPITWFLFFNVKSLFLQRWTYFNTFGLWTSQVHNNFIPILLLDLFEVGYRFLYITCHLTVWENLSHLQVARGEPYHWRFVQLWRDSWWQWQQLSQLEELRVLFLPPGAGGVLALLLHDGRRVERDGPLLFPAGWRGKEMNGLSTIQIILFINRD